jgi:hypothetical protein
MSTIKEWLRSLWAWVSGLFGKLWMSAPVADGEAPVAARSKLATAWSYVTWFFGLVGTGLTNIYKSPLTVRLALLTVVVFFGLGCFVAGHRVAVTDWKPKADMAQTNLTITQGALEKATNAKNSAISRLDAAERELAKLQTFEPVANQDGAPVASLTKPIVRKRKPVLAPDANPIGFKFPSIF